MGKRINVYPPNGGEAIEIYEQDLDSFEAKGWRTDSPRSSKPKAVKTAKPETQSED
jgi:hypothetical protein